MPSQTYGSEEEAQDAFERLALAAHVLTVHLNGTTVTWTERDDS